MSDEMMRSAQLPLNQYPSTYAAVQRIVELEAEIAALKAKPVAAQQREWQSLNDEQVEAIVRTKGDELIDHIYEHGTVAEGTDEKLKAIVHAADICLRAKNEEKNHR